MSANGGGGARMNITSGISRRADGCIVSVIACVVLAVASPASGADDLSLIEAVRNRDSRTAAALVAEEVDVNATQPDGATALHWAAQWDDVSMAEVLIRAGARADVANDYGATPLSMAALNGSEPMVERLLEAGAPPNTVLPSGETALMTAARSGSVEVVKALVAAGANVNATELALGQTALMWAVAERHMDVAQTLVESGANAGARSASGFTPLLFAARMGDRDLVRFFLEKGADINETAEDGTTPLAVATVRGHAALAEWLLDRGADPNKDTIGYSALHWAAGTFDTRSTHEYTTEDGEWQALAGIASRDAKLRLILALLEHGADVNARVKSRMPRFGYSLGGGSITGGGSYVGATPFFLAATVGDTEIMRLLLANGADPLLATKDRTTPLMATAGISFVEEETSATESQLLDALKLTLKLGDDLNATNTAGSTALHATAYVGFNVIAQFLVDQGAVVNARDKAGRTPLTIAAGIPRLGMFFSQPETEELLRTLGGIE